MIKISVRSKLASSQQIKVSKKSKPEILTIWPKVSKVCIILWYKQSKVRGNISLNFSKNKISLKFCQRLSQTF